jgi:hypothetical protein
LLVHAFCEFNLCLELGLLRRHTLELVLKRLLVQLKLLDLALVIDLKGLDLYLEIFDLSVFVLELLLELTTLLKRFLSWLLQLALIHLLKFKKLHGWLATGLGLWLWDRLLRLGLVRIYRFYHLGMYDFLLRLSFLELPDLCF